MDSAPIEPVVAPSPEPALAAAAPADHPPSEFTFRRFLESSVLFLSAILLLRATVIEPFGVPTGSMAPMLAGNHKSCACPRCGHPVMVGSSAGRANDQHAYQTAQCPNCDQGDLGLPALPETAGDRLLVDKNVFELRPPRRWEVAVFRPPADPTKPYVKRVVGLPGEKVQVVDGDVYVNGQLARKTLAEVLAVRLPVFDNDHQPKDRGWGVRWRSGSPRETRPGVLLTEAADRLDGTELKWPAADEVVGFRWLLYRNWLLDDRREDAIRDAFVYNGRAEGHLVKNVHDFVVELDVEVGPGVGVFAVGLRDGRDDVTAELPTGAAAPVRVVDRDGKSYIAGESFQLAAGRTHRVIFAFVDRRISLSVDGRELIAPVDLPAAADRLPVTRPTWLGAKGVAATVRHFRLGRDIHYAPAGRNAVYEPWPLGPDEYFMLGDNSANSEDSRYWTTPGVPRAALMGKPLLVTQPCRWSSAFGYDFQTIDWPRIHWIR